MDINYKSATMDLDLLDRKVCAFAFMCVRTYIHIHYKIIQASIPTTAETKTKTHK
jgi:hypothetical protein